MTFEEKDARRPQGQKRELGRRSSKLVLDVLSGKRVMSRGLNCRKEPPRKPDPSIGGVAGARSSRCRV